MWERKWLLSPSHPLPEGGKGEIKGCMAGPFAHRPGLLGEHEGRESRFDTPRLGPERVTEVWMLRCLLGRQIPVTSCIHQTQTRLRHILPLGVCWCLLVWQARRHETVRLGMFGLSRQYCSAAFWHRGTPLLPFCPPPPHSHSHPLIWADGVVVRG